MSQDGAKQPSFARGLIFLAVIGVAVLSVAGFIYVQRGEESPVNIPTERARALSVNAAPVVYRDTLVLDEQFTGIVLARRSSALGFETGGRITSINVDIGDSVSENQVLARLDTRALNARLLAANAQISEAQAAVQLAETTRERQAFLIERDLLSSQSFDEVQTQVDAANARLAAAEAQAQTLRVQIELASIRAPFAGVITERRVDEGAIAAPGQPMLQLVEIGVPEVRIGLPPDVASRLSVDDDYSISIQGREVSSRLKAITGVIETNGRTVTAIFELPEATGIAPGATARLNMSEELDQRGVWVPISALTEASRGLWAVYGEREAVGRAHQIDRQLVDIIHSETDRVFVRGALHDGDMFVMDGLHRLVPGMNVTPVVHTDLAMGG